MIKKFENFSESSPDIPKYRFIIIKNFTDNNDLEIYERIGEGNFPYKYLLKLFWDKNLNMIRSWIPKDNYHHILKKKSDFFVDNNCNILYETNDYDDAREKLELLGEAEKYNL